MYKYTKLADPRSRLPQNANQNRKKEQISDPFAQFVCQQEAADTSGKVALTGLIMRYVCHHFDD